ncbi:Glycosyl hydrolase family 61 [Scedosporium apiospermum]|uniref:lytic cellulose monooxygenase (C4-dehydrogenating) n=1 Tax=Pseudallescheria apiosperma TaxID=563466 RepID=A0A084GEI0_PSEDA|nr:Glycosyl hydrolase family 61 [Scedosporium apiospermum]KEZ45742.1 Glycosyl hydrolase family 61 [Scedosporium apiospermum]
MKLSVASVLAYSAIASAHCIFQRLSVDGQDQGSLVGLRAPNQNNPVQNVQSQDLTCGVVASKSEAVIKVPAGSKVGSWWQHVIGGAQFPGDPDNPIAPSHHGPVSAYLAKVDNAATASHQGLDWFKVAEDNLDTSSGVWGVDNMIKGQGWHYFTMPSCIAPGHYLLRVELLALHSAHQNMGAQFYTSCAQIEVTGSGTFTPTQTVKIPGAFQQNDPAVLVNIYAAGGVANNNGKPYQAPGPRPITC